MQLTFNQDTKQFDITIINGEIVEDDTPISDIIVSMFSNINWFGNQLPKNTIGSSLEDFIKLGLLNSNTQNEVINSITSACNWLIVGKRITSINASFEFSRITKRIELVILVTLPNNQTKSLNIPMGN